MGNIVACFFVVVFRSVLEDISLLLSESHPRHPTTADTKVVHKQSLPS